MSVEKRAASHDVEEVKIDAVQVLERLTHTYICMYIRICMYACMCVVLCLCGVNDFSRFAREICTSKDLRHELPHWIGNKWAAQTQDTPYLCNARKAPDSIAVAQHKLELNLRKKNTVFKTRVKRLISTDRG